ncbi:hypothetical protein [Tuwongella immobilis]|uniref:Uncharacterized protein n=1 Tax=Tuwongella immobilis TaxID=692036 RepID=A0A6C2YKN1_9BACT|nr:hypothetical protein [Tuwongella immobilis]VIP01789.1 unnamed protein product [Tuwongella immobilis]VTR99454.1 unnamed protein product [Tuwongella immobilis]
MQLSKSKQLLMMAGIPVLLGGALLLGMHLTATVGIAQDRKPAEAEASVVELVREIGPSHYANKEQRFNDLAWAVRISSGKESVIGVAIRFGGDEFYDLDLDTTRRILAVFRKLANSPKPPKTLVEKTFLDLSFTTLQRKLGGYRWEVLTTDEGHQRDVREAKEWCVAIEAALKDSEAFAKIEPAYRGD